MADTDQQIPDWWAWHLQYDIPGSGLHARTEVVHRHVRTFLDSCPPGEPVRIVSACAGQGRELLPVIAAHERRPDVRARLVELDPRNVQAACDTVSELRLDWSVEIVHGDASLTDAYAGAVPADLIVLCGVFGCIPIPDIQNTIGLLPELCAPGATVLWTLQRGEPDRTPELLAMFESAGFEAQRVETPNPEVSWVGTHRFAGVPRQLTLGRRLFSFPTYLTKEGATS